MRPLTLILIALTGVATLAQEPKQAETADFARLRIEAERGDANAQSSLGWMYLNGEGVGKDPKEAAKWVRMAADQGNALALTNLGSMYLNGEGVAKNPKEAVRLVRKAAEQGCAVAAWALPKT